MMFYRTLVLLFLLPFFTAAQQVLVVVNTDFNAFESITSGDDKVFLAEPGKKIWYRLKGEPEKTKHAGVIDTVQEALLVISGKPIHLDSLDMIWLVTPRKVLQKMAGAILLSSGTGLVMGGIFLIGDGIVNIVNWNAGFRIFFGVLLVPTGMITALIGASAIKFAKKRIRIGPDSPWQLKTINLADYRPGPKP